jgi:RNA recognition motif-containing protein
MWKMMGDVMSAKIYIDNIAASTTEHELKELFSAYGNVVEVNVVVERTPQKPRSFGFIIMVTLEGARAAIQALHGRRIAEHTLIVSEATPGKEHAALCRKPGKQASQAKLYGKGAS